MSFRYEWVDDDHIIMKLYIEAPWVWEDFHQAIKTMMPIIEATQHPVGLAIDVNKIGMLPRGNFIQHLIHSEQVTAKNLVSTVIIGAHYTITVFMNLVTKLRPDPKNPLRFTESPDEAYAIIRARCEEVNAAKDGKSSN
jgi:hypothetical protein